MAQNVTVQGASYSDVPAVVLPKTGGGTATFTDTTIATNAAVAADIASGKLAYVNGTLITGTASGGGGASNVVTGTFKGTTSGAVLDVNLAYTGTGYPIAVVIFPTEGAYNSSGTFYNTVSRYAEVTYIALKTIPGVAPTYSGTATADSAFVWRTYKSSASAAATISGSALTGSNATTLPYTDVAASGTSGYNLRIRSATKLSVKIQNSSISPYYGFAANVEYTYWVIYSS